MPTILSKQFENYTSKQGVAIETLTYLNKRINITLLFAFWAALHSELLLQRNPSTPPDQTVWRTQQRRAVKAIASGLGISSGTWRDDRSVRETVRGLA